MAGSFSWNSVDLSTYGLYLLDDWELDLIPEVRERIAIIPGKDGFYDYDPELGPRYFRLRCHCQADSHAGLITNLLALESVLDPHVGTKKLKFDSIGTAKYWNARLTSVQVVKIHALHAELVLNFVAPDPTTQTEA